ncbi:MAG TPA: Sec-independent protein translocase protein TatB [Steroidobacteraceae bacterium]
MLDVGFSEILLTSAIALIVLGPEKLPKVARQVGNWVGRARLMARQLTEQLEREVSADELMKQTKSTPINAPKTYDSSNIDPYYTPNEPTVASPPVVAPGMPAEPSVKEPSAAYSPEKAAAVQGADWHASPPENKPANE